MKPILAAVVFWPICFGQISYNLETDFGSASTCTGVGSDNAAMNAFESAAVAWRGSNAGKITLNIPLQGTTISVSGATAASPVVVTTSTSYPGGWTTGQWLWMAGLGVVPDHVYQITAINGTQFSLNGTTGTGSFTGLATASSNVCLFPTTLANVSGALGLLTITSPAPGVVFSDAGGLNTFQTALGAGGVSSVGPAGRFSARVATVPAGSNSITLLPTLSVSTTGTASSGSTALTVASSPLGIAIGQIVAGAGIQTGTTISNVSGTAVTLSLTTSSALSGTPITFTTSVSSLCTMLGPFPATHIMTGIDLQGNGFPPNPGVYEYIVATSCNSSTGAMAITSLANQSSPFGLINAYKSTWPLYNPGGPFQNDEGGPATLFHLPASWGTLQLELDNISIDQAGQTYTSGSSVTWNGGSWMGANCPIPTSNGTWSAINISGPACYIEVDKMIDTVIINNSTFSGFNAASSSVRSFQVINGSNINGTGINGSLTNFVCSNSTISSMSFGVGSFGIGKTANLNNCSMGTTNAVAQSLQQAFSQLGYSISNGVITVPNGTCCTTGGPILNAVPGGAYYFKGPPVGIASNPFTIVDMTQDSTNTYLQTSLLGGIPPLPSGTPQILAFPNISFTCISCSGNANAVDLNGAPPGAALYTYTSRTFSPITSGNLLYPGGTIWGSIVSITINVTTPYTGSDAGTLTFSPMGRFFIPVLNASGSQMAYNPVINTKIAGARIITPNGVTGQQTGDSGLSLGGPVWIYGQMQPFISSTISGVPDSCAGATDVPPCPTIVVTVQTTQSSQQSFSVFGNALSVGPSYRKL